jgi:hypothetical protein
MEVLREKHYATLHFDVHTPIVFNKLLFPEIMGRFDYKEGIGYTMKSLYGNVMYPDGEFLTDQKQKIFRNYRLSAIRSMLSAPMFMSFNDQGLNQALKWWLYDTFPERSRYEKNDADDKIFELYQWYKTGKPWSEGIKLFGKYYNHKNLQRLFEAGETPVLRKKIEFKMMQAINEL